MVVTRAAVQHVIAVIAIQRVIAGQAVQIVVAAAGLFTVAIDGVIALGPDGADLLRGQADGLAVAEFQFFNDIAGVISAVDAHRAAGPGQQQVAVQQPFNGDIGFQHALGQDDAVVLVAVGAVVLDEIVARTGQIGIAAGTAVGTVIAGAADQRVIAIGAIEVIVIGAAIEDIILAIAIQPVDPAQPAQHVFLRDAAIVAAQIVVGLGAAGFDRQGRHLAGHGLAAEFELQHLDRTIGGEMVLHEQTVFAGLDGQIVGQGGAEQGDIAGFHPIAHHHGVLATLFDDGFRPGGTIGVVAGAALADIGAGPADQRIAPGTTDQNVIAQPAGQLVIAGLAFENVGAFQPLQNVIAALADNAVGQDEIADIALQPVGPAGADDALGLAFKVEDGAVAQRQRFHRAGADVEILDPHDQLARSIDLQVFAIVLRFEEGQVGQVQPGLDFQQVFAGGVDDGVETAAVDIGVIAVAALHQVIARPAVQHVIAFAGIQVVIAAQADQRVVAIAGAERIPAAAAAQVVIPGGAVQAQPLGRIDGVQHLVDGDAGAAIGIGHQLVQLFGHLLGQVVDAHRGVDQAHQFGPDKGHVGALVLVIAGQRAKAAHIQLER